MTRNHYTADALVLRTYTLGESDRIVVFLTRDRGKKRGVAKNARQSRRRFGAALEPMTTGRVSYVEHEQRDLVRLEYVELRRSPLQGAQADALLHASYFAELIDQSSPDADPNEALFRLGVSVMEAMSAGVAVDPLARYFEYWLLRLQGVYEGDASLSQDAREFLQCARVSSPLAIGDASVTGHALRELEAAHRSAIAAHLERELRSLNVLKELRR